VGNRRIIESWSSADYAASWRNADGLAALLELPWAMATELIGREREPRLIVDVGSGPGRFLARVLQAYPKARGVWIDASSAMQAQAQEYLAPFADRVEYVVEDAARLTGIGAARGADVVLNSRVAHHFDHAGLIAFYRSAAEVMQPQGWLVTLDHILPPGDWDRRYRDALPSFAGAKAGRPTHPHYYPFPTMADHLEAMTRAGLGDCDVAWRAFYTCLFLGRRPMNRTTE
jgi:SAM-dependent methyltransferase